MSARSGVDCHPPLPAMLLRMDEMLWPLRGVLLFLRSPRWWIRPLLGMALAMGALVGLGIGTSWALWPTGGAWPIAETSGWWWWARALIAIGVAVATVLVAWALVLPLLLSLLLEDLARKASAYARERHADPLLATRAASHELPLVPGLLASLKVLGATLPTRLGWMGSGLVSGLLVPPLGIVISTLGMGHVACIDAIDTALGLRGYDGHQRLVALKAHRGEVRQAALIAGLMHLGLAATIIGWLVWLPGIVVGAALRVRAWDDPPASAGRPSTEPPPFPAGGGSAMS